MSKATVDVFESTLQKSHVWLKRLNETLGWEDQHRSYVILRAVLQALRDRLTIEGTAKFGAQLPMLIRGFYYEGWVPAHAPIKIRSKDDFIDLVRDYLGSSNLSFENNLEEIVVKVFRVLREQIGEAEIKHISETVPHPIRELFIK